MVKISLYTESNSWQLATGNDKELESPGKDCPMTNSLKSVSECIMCSDKKLYEGGLSFSFDNSKVVFEQNDSLVYYPIKDRIIGDKIGPVVKRNGESLADVIGSDLAEKLIKQDSNSVSLDSKAAEYIDKEKVKHLAVSAPGDEGITNPGALVFYVNNDTHWEYDGRVDGTITGQHLGSQEIKFLNENTLEVVSEGQFVSYYVNVLVS